MERVKAGADPGDPVFPNYSMRNEESLYSQHRENLASAMGLYSCKGLDPYSGRKLYNRCLRLLPVSEMQRILNEMGRYINVLDIFVAVNAYIAMRQSPYKLVDFNWETYDAQVGPEGWRACILRAIELALSFGPKPADAKPVPSMPDTTQDVSLVASPEIEQLLREYRLLRVDGSTPVLSHAERFNKMAKMHELSSRLRKVGIDPDAPQTSQIPLE